MHVFESIQFLDDNWEDFLVLGKCSDFVQYINDSSCFYAAFGNNEFRSKRTESLKEKRANVTNIIHPSAYISPKTVLGKGNCYNTKSNHQFVLQYIGWMCTLELYVYAFLGSIVRSDNRFPFKMNVSPGSLIEKEEYK